jgi:integrase
LGGNVGAKFDSLSAGGNIFRTVQSEWKASLETTVFSVAKQRLPETMREHRAKLESVAAVTIGKMTVGDAARIYLEKVRANVSLKPRSKDYRQGLIDFINRSWPALFGMEVRKVSERDCQEWLVRFQKLYAPSVVNNAIGTPRAVFAEAVDRGARFGNPAANLSRMRIRAKRLELPSREEFLRFVEEIRTAGARQSKDCANLVRFLAYSGLRIGEAKFVTWADANFARHQLCVRGDPVTATKNGETRYVPMIPELGQMLTEL